MPNHIWKISRDRDTDIPLDILFKWRIVSPVKKILSYIWSFLWPSFACFSSVLDFLELWGPELEIIFPMHSEQHWEDWDDPISTCANNVPRDADQDQFCLCGCSSMLIYVYLGCLSRLPSKATPQTHNPSLYWALWSCHLRYSLFTCLC